MEQHILKLYRLCHFLYCKHAKTSGKIRYFYSVPLIIFNTYYTFLLSVFYGAHIPYSVKIGRNIKFSHSYHGIFISRNTVIGSNCIITQHTTIGSNQPNSFHAPVIGDNVYIGANCCIVGKVEIRNNCIIGAGTTIAKGIIPEGSRVVGQKYKILNDS